jgi:hypothetical protein
MQRYGKTATGRQRWFCIFCNISRIGVRIDTTKRHYRDAFQRWLCGEASEQEIAHQLGISRQSVWNHFHPFFAESWHCRFTVSQPLDTLIVDGKYIHKDSLCTLIALANTGDIYWEFASEENGITWHHMLAKLPAPVVVVCDGQKGLLRVIRSLWSRTKIQRCHFHMVSYGIQMLTRNPQTPAGKEILQFLHRLKDIHTHTEKERWILLFRLWEKQYQKVWGEKNEQGVYANKKIRSVRGLIKRALPDLFTYLDYDVPNTTNLVEGWLNTRIADAIRQHRGLSQTQKKTLVSVLLRKLSAEKPTRKFT